MNAHKYTLRWRNGHEVASQDISALYAEYARWGGRWSAESFAAAVGVLDRNLARGYTVRARYDAGETDSVQWMLMNDGSFAVLERIALK